MSEKLKQQGYEVEEIIKDGRVKNVNVKPPLGLKPRYIHEKCRGIEIVRAMARYITKDKAIPEEWFDELQYLHGESNADL